MLHLQPCQAKAKEDPAFRYDPDAYRSLRLKLSDQHAKEEILKQERAAAAAAEMDAQIRQRKYVGLDYNPLDYDPGFYRGVRMTAYTKTREVQEQQRARQDQTEKMRQAAALQVQRIVRGHFVRKAMRSHPSYIALQERLRNE